MKVLGTILVAILALIGLAAVLALFWLRFKFRGAMKEKLEQMREEEKVLETADWIGRTGLDEETERELSRYLRRELGESLFDEGALKAGDLRYVGAFDEEGSKAHYWHMPYGKEERVFAYCDVSPDGETCLGWGNREPPRQGS